MAYTVFELKQGQEIMLGHEIRVMVVGFDRSGRPRLGIEAPRSVSVDRWEVRQRKIAGMKDHRVNIDGE